MKTTKLILCLIILLIATSGCITGGETQKEEQVTQTTVVMTTTAPTTQPPKISSTPPLLGVEYQEISVQEVMEKIENKEDILILDVRSPGEFEEGYIEGAILIPFQELGQRHKELNVLTDKEIIVYCKAGVRSKNGAQQLTELGYTNVKEMGAGIDGWAAAGGEVVKPTTIPVPTTTSPPKTTWAPTTTTPPTTAPSKIYFKGEPNIIVPTDKETEFSIKTYDIIQIGDALLSYHYDAGQCVALQTWEFAVYRNEGGNWVYEKSVAYTEGGKVTVPPTDWSQMFHDKTDALDNYDILIKYGTLGKLTVTSIPK
ncbi:MAG: rhodanese-like domain-containing protein [Candidatus Hydrothermarchaeales archaeon]